MIDSFIHSRIFINSMATFIGIGKRLLAVLCIVLSAALVVLVESESSNYKCKNATSPWPLPCNEKVNPSSRVLPRMRIASPNASFPISAWWPPVGYDDASGKEAKIEFEAYAAAGFTNVQVSDRGSARCTDDWTKSWNYIVQNIKNAAAANMTVLIDTYRCKPWGGSDNEGGDAQGPTNGYVKPGFNHKITLPEVKWLAPRLLQYENVVGLLITDDGVDLARNEIEEIEWMIDNTPSLFPWVNQCGDGSEWIARAGTPYAVPELYSVNIKTTGTDAQAEAQCANQISGYDSWYAKGARFGLKLFPLINVGDGGDTGTVRSDSLVRFQGYSALAYGSKGLMWYCWGRGVWNITTAKPTEIYNSISQVNSQVKAWGPTVLAFDDFYGAYHTGWLGPSATSTSPAPGKLVETMDDMLMVGVLGKTESADELLLVIVDKRVSAKLAPLPKRSVSIRLSSMVEIAEPVESKSASVSQVGSFSVINAELVGGDAVVVRISGANIRTLAAAISTWRYNTTVPSLGVVKTNQYNYYFKSDMEQTAFVLGARGLGDRNPSDLAGLRFNTLISPDENVGTVLNPAMQNGMFVLAESAMWSPASLTSQFDAHLCHPNFAGAYQRIANLSDVSDMGRVVDAFRVRAPGSFFALSAQGAYRDIASAAANVGAPMFAVQVNLSESTGGFHYIIKAVSETWNAHHLALIVDASICKAASPRDVRAAASATLLFGGRGIIFSDCGFGDPLKAETEEALRDSNAYISHIGDQMLGMTPRAVFSTAPFPVPSASTLNSTGSWIAAMSDGVIAAIFDKDGSSTPPMVFVMNANAMSTFDEQQVSVQFANGVVGFSPVAGDQAAGFEKCAKFVLGATANLSLAPGQSVLLTLTVMSSE